MEYLEGETLAEHATLPCQPLPHLGETHTKLVGATTGWA